MRTPRGQILIVAVLVLAGALIASLALLAAGTTARVGIQRNRATRTARALADAGVARAAYCFNQTSAGVCGNAVGVHYAGETNLALGSGTVTTTITSVSDTRKRITTTGRTTGGPGSAATVTITQDAVLSASPIGFRYGAQAGAQGVRMDNNSTVDGNVFANGSITGGNGTRITGDAIVAAGTPVTDVVRVDAMPTTLIVARSSPIIDIAQRFTVPTSAPLRTVTIPIKKIGSPPSASIRILLNTEENQPSSTEVARATLSSSSVFTSMAWINVTYTTQPVLIAGRTYWFVLDATTRSPNDYWMVGFNPASPGSLASADWSSRQWQDAGGTIAHRITTGGDTRIDGVAVGHDARAHTINRAQVNGSAWATDLTVSTVGGSAMASAIVRGTIGGNATARTISSSTIGGSVWCETITSSTVGGRRNCPVAVTPPTDPTAAPFPISTEEIQTWIADARAGGTITGNYEPPSDTTVSLGPKEIIGDLELDNGQHLIITGTIHVTGNVNVGNHGSITLDPAYGSNSGMLIADGTIHLENNGTMHGSGSPGSSLMLITHATGGGHHDSAIDIHNGANGTIFYAPNGTINLHNTATVSQLTADGITMSEGARLTYDQGFLDARFTSGPAAAWTLVPGTWAAR